MYKHISFLIVCLPGEDVSSITIRTFFGSELHPQCLQQCLACRTPRRYLLNAWGQSLPSSNHTWQVTGATCGHRPVTTASKESRLTLRLTWGKHHLTLVHGRPCKCISLPERMGQGPRLPSPGSMLSTHGPRAGCVRTRRSSSAGSPSSRCRTPCYPEAGACCSLLAGSGNPRKEMPWIRLMPETILHALTLVCHGAFAWS